MSSGSGAVEGVASISPFLQFDSWMKDARRCEPEAIGEPEAGCLSTCTEDGKPSSRMIVLSGYSENGFTFTTNVNSRKAMQLSKNPYASLLFYWMPLGRQVKVEGMVEKLPESARETVDYYNSLTIEQQAKVTLSPCSSEIPSMADLEHKHSELVQKHSITKAPIPMPPQFTGYILVPTMIEFWQGKLSWMDDRTVFQRIGELEWEVKHLAP